MALVTIRNYCDYIQMAGVVQVILPDRWLQSGGEERIPTLYLLAPEGEEGSRWLRHTQAELLANQYQVAMVLISCLQGCYTDMTYGYRFFQSLSLGVPAYLKRILPALRVDEGACYIAGCSIGGMGAIKLALSDPGRFAAVGSFSGRLFNEESFRHPVAGDWLTLKRMVNLWGSPDAIRGTQNDLGWLAQNAISSGGKLPSFYLTCGTDDPGRASSMAFAGIEGLDLSYHEDLGRHGWHEWAAGLERFLQWCAHKGGNPKCL